MNDIVNEYVFSVDKIGTEDQDCIFKCIEKGEEPWLCENNLADKLKIIFPKYNILKNKMIKYDDFKFFPDIRIDEIKVLIEFRGKHHFNKTRVILKDRHKRFIARCLGLDYIEIPYFVQLTPEVIKYHFGKYTDEFPDLSNGFPHGFINPIALLPCDFCKRGVDYYKEYISLLPKNVKDNILNSTEKWSNILEIDWMI